MIGSLDWQLATLGQTLTTRPEWRLRWDWEWPVWLTLLAIVLAMVWVLSIYLHENSSAGIGTRVVLSLLRLAALTLVAVMFAQPAVEWFRPGQARLVLLLDRSASMKTLDRFPAASSDISRLAAMQEFLTEGRQPLVEKLQRDYQLSVIAFDKEFEQFNPQEISMVDQVRALQARDAAESGTQLGDAIDHGLRELPGEPPVAIVALTDGIVTGGQTLQQAAERARQLRIPLHLVCVGSDRLRPDIAVENLLVEEIVFPGDRLQVEATVHATGYAGKSVEAVLRAGERELAHTSFQLPADGETTIVRLGIRPDKPGDLELELAVPTQDGEQNQDNNSARQVVEVRDEKIRVLLAQAQPSYEYRALKSLLERDPAVELRVVLQEADADYPAVDATALRTFPSSEKELFSYDVLLLGDVDPGLMPRSVWPLVERFVSQRGGGLVAIAGPRFMPAAYRGLRSFETLLPLQLQTTNPLRSQIGGNERISVLPTAQGWRTPSLQLGETRAETERVWRALPPVTWLQRVENAKAGAVVLAESASQADRGGTTFPVILRHLVGAGEVWFHATDETWRWRWRTDDRYFARYWGQVVRRLGRGRLAAGRQGIRLTANRSQYKPGEPIQLQARFRNPAQAPAENTAVAVQLQGSTGPPQQVTLSRRLGRRGVFAAQVEGLPADSYEAILVRPEAGAMPEAARFTVQRPLRELAEVAVNRQGLHDAAELSGGKSYAIEDAAQLLAELPAPQQQTLDSRPTLQLWNSHIVLALLVSVLVSEWLLRRRHGML